MSKTVKKSPITGMPAPVQDSPITETKDPNQLEMGLGGGSTAPSLPPMDSEQLRKAVKLDLEAASAFLIMIKQEPEILEAIAQVLEKLHKSAGPLIDHMKQEVKNG